MRYAMIMAGGSGTRLWPMSRADQPKQLIPLFGGRSLLQVAVDRLAGRLPPERIFVCAAAAYRDQVLAALPELSPAQYLSEPVGRDTLNAVGYPAAVLARDDPEAVIAVFTADHLITPIDVFQRLVEQAFELAEEQPRTLVTFGITPTGPATGYGYLELGEPVSPTSRRVRQFREKPDLATAQAWVAAGPDEYLWNSGMFVWRAATLLDCLARYEPATHAGLTEIAAAWDTPVRDETLARVYPTLRKISVDFAIMEPASRDATVQVAAIPMALDWLDVGSWPTFARTCEHDADDNALAARHILLDTRGTLVASNDPDHLIATIGCADLIIIHTPRATLVCRADQAEAIKELHRLVGERVGAEWL
jgi:mannose-1-phosphate guanylyltransferase